MYQYISDCLYKEVNLIAAKLQQLCYLGWEIQINSNYRLSVFLLLYKLPVHQCPELLM